MQAIAMTNQREQNEQARMRALVRFNGLMFHSLDRNWKMAPVVPALGYPEYRERMAQLIRRHAAPGPVQRLLFRPWLVREKVVPASQPVAGGPAHWPQPRVRPA